MIQLCMVSYAAGCSVRKQCCQKCCHPRDVVQPCSHLQVFVETTGWAFAYPLVWLAGCRVASYTHYPTVSTNMLQRVMARTAAFNNDAQVRLILKASAVGSGTSSIDWAAAAVSVCSGRSVCGDCNPM